MSTLLPLLSNSSLTTFRRCPREYQFRYVMLRKPRSKTVALRFGTLFHVGLNAWWLAGNTPASAKLFVAVDAMRRRCEDTPIESDPYELAKAEALMVGYTARWGDERYETIAVEKQFRLPLVAPTTEDHDRYEYPGKYDLGGAIDGIVSRFRGSEAGQRVHLIEHKTTSLDISGGSDYWRHVVALDPQVSTYMAAARQLGYAADDCLYDVIRKPAILPLLATPEESRKYTKPTKTEPIPRLYANQRETDETPDEYGSRVTDEIVNHPDKYFARMTIVRLDRDNAEHARDVYQTAQMIHFAETNHAWPRTPSACERYGRLCEYHDVCSGIANIDDDSRYMTKTKTHEELSDG